MTNRLFSLFAVCALLGLTMLACGGAADNANTAANANAVVANTTASTAAPTGDKIGVAECDDFIAKYEACVSGKVPAAQQAMFKNSIEQWRKSWKDLAANPTTKATLASVCKTQLDQSKASLSSFGCTW